MNPDLEIARAATLPVFHLTGVLDPVVPWPPMQRWLRRECPGWRANSIVWTADHNVLGTGTEAAVRWVLRWLTCPPGTARESRVSQDSA